MQMHPRCKPGSPSVSEESPAAVLRLVFYQVLLFSFRIMYFGFVRSVTLLLLCLCVQATVIPAEETRPWPSPVPGFQEPQPGEHPRLFFRKSDIPALRERMQTLEGQAILERLRTLLGNNGEQFPDQLNTRHPVNIRGASFEELPIGTFTIGHPAGYGLLYVLTGDTKYADMARTGLEWMFDAEKYSVTADVIKKERGHLFTAKSKRMQADDLSDLVITYGQPDRDERYTWTRPGAQLRLGALMLTVAMAYDFCYDAWPEDFRLRVVNEIQNYRHLPVDYDKYSEGHRGEATMNTLVNSRFPPRSNHFGAYIGGAGVALLAIRNDPGADMNRITPWLKRIEDQMIRNMTQGFGDKGFFAEGHGPSHLSANNAFVPLLQAARVSWGKDFISPRSNAPWITLRWAMEIVPGKGDKAWYPNYKKNPYGDRYKWRGSMSDAGEWSQGFGALTSVEEQAAMLWTYEKAMEKEKPLKEFDAWVYPHRAVFAFINWPIGVEPRNPGEVLGHANADAMLGHFMFRREWKDENDVYITLFLNTPTRRGYVRSSSGGNITMFGHGIKEFFRRPMNGKKKVTYYQTEEDGSGVVSFTVDGKPSSVAVELGRETGTEGLVVVANPWFSSDIGYLTDPRQLARRKKNAAGYGLHVDYLTAGNTPYFVMCIYKDAPPPINATSQGLRIGTQLFQLEQGNLISRSIAE